MPIVRYMAALLIGLLMGWGGLGGHGAHMAMAGQPSGMPSAAMMTDHGDGGTHAAHHHEDGAGTHDGHAAKTGMPACCLFACGLATALPPPGLGFSDVGWQVLRLAVPIDDVMTGRSVSPLRRPPRHVA